MNINSFGKFDINQTKPSLADRTGPDRKPKNAGRRNGVRPADVTKTYSTRESAVTSANLESLSEKAKEFYERLKEKYADCDFFIANSDDEMRTASRLGNKEISVIFSADEIERMAEDEEYASERLKQMEEAIDTTKGLISTVNEDETGEYADVKITRVTISVNDDGTTTFFAELEKVNEKQRERIEKKREESRAEDKKNAEDKKKADDEKRVRPGKLHEQKKRVIVNSQTGEGLLKSIKEVPWDMIPEFTKPIGGKIDYSV